MTTPARVNGITLFTAPKPFSGHIGLIQRNALRSWAALGERVEILVLGDEAGAREAAVDVGARYLGGVSRSSHGTPLLSTIFGRASTEASHARLAYLNTDIVLMEDFLPSVDRVQAVFTRYLIVGQRWDLAVRESLDFRPDGRAALARRLREEGRRHRPTGSDYFVFPRGCFEDLPAFALGRAGWDNWMIYAARRAGWPVVDASQAITIIHQDHDYAHLPGGRAHYRLTESRRNVELGGGQMTIFTLHDATWRLTGGGLRRSTPLESGLGRWMEAGLISRLGSSRTTRLVRLALHPWRTLDYFLRRFRTRRGTQDDAP